MAGPNIVRLSGVSAYVVYTLLGVQKLHHDEWVLALTEKPHACFKKTFSTDSPKKNTNNFDKGGIKQRPTSGTDLKLSSLLKSKL